MYRRIAILLFLLLNVCVLLAQQAPTYKEVRDKTYAYYYKGEWKELAEYGKQARKQGFDFYELNYRTGIAFFKLGQYFKAMQFFEHAYKNNMFSVEAKEYLYLCYLYTGHEWKAYDLAEDMSEASLKRMHYEQHRPLDYYSLLGGIKISDFQDSVGTAYYATAGLGHRIGNRFRVDHAYTYLQQDFYWGDYDQHQYYIRPELYIDKGISLVAAFHYVNLKAIENRLLPNNDPPRIDVLFLPPTPQGHIPMDSVFGTLIGEDLVTGTTTQKVMTAYLGVKAKVCRLTLQPYFSYNKYQEDRDLNFQSLREVYTKRYIMGNLVEEFTFFDTINAPTIDDTSYQIIQLGGSFNFVLPFWGDRVAVGADISAHINNGETNILAWPYIGARVHKVLGIQLGMYKGNVINYNSAEARNIYNVVDPVQLQATALTNFYIGKHLNLYLVYQYEQREDEAINKDYRFHSIFTGIKFRL